MKALNLLITGALLSLHIGTQANAAEGDCILSDVRIVTESKPVMDKQNRTICINENEIKITLENGIIELQEKLIMKTGTVMGSDQHYAIILNMGSSEDGHTGNLLMMGKGGSSIAYLLK